MSLNSVVKAEVSKNIEKYEGRIPHLYLDTVGKVTVGIGHMIPNKSSMTNVVMYTKGNNNILRLSTLSEKALNTMQSKDYLLADVSVQDSIKGIPPLQ